MSRRQKRPTAPRAIPGKPSSDEVLEVPFTADDAAQGKHRATLGLDPRSEAELARERATAVTLGANLEALSEQGRKALGDAEQDQPADNLAGRVLKQDRATAAPYDSRYPDDQMAVAE